MKLLIIGLLFFSLNSLALTQQEIDEFVNKCAQIKQIEASLNNGVATANQIRQLQELLLRVRQLDGLARGSRLDTRAAEYLQRAEQRVQQIIANSNQDQNQNINHASINSWLGETASTRRTLTNPSLLHRNHETASNAPSDLSVARSFISAASTRLTRQGAFSFQQVTEENLWHQIMQDIDGINIEQNLDGQRALLDVLRFFAGNDQNRRQALNTYGQANRNFNVLLEWATQQVNAFSRLAGVRRRTQAAQANFATQNRMITLRLEYLNRYFESESPGHAARIQALFSGIQNNVQVTEAVQRANNQPRAAAQRRERADQVAAPVNPANVDLVNAIALENWEELVRQYPAQTIVDYYNQDGVAAMPNELKKLLGITGPRGNYAITRNREAILRLYQAPQQNQNQNSNLASGRSSGNHVSSQRSAGLSVVPNLMRARQHQAYPTVAQFPYGIVQVEVIENRGQGHCFYEATGITIEQFILDVGQNLNDPVVQGFLAGNGDIEYNYNVWAANLGQNLGANGEHIALFRAVYGQLLIMVIQGNQWVPLAGQPAINWQEPVTVVGYTGDGDHGHYVGLIRVMHNNDQSEEHEGQVDNSHHNNQTQNQNNNNGGGGSGGFGGFFSFGSSSTSSK